MNESIKKALLKQKIRRSHIINLKEQATLYSTFIEPFSDAISAVKLGSQEVLSAARLAWDTITLSPKKMEEALAKHKGRMDSIKQKWEPIMNRNMEALKRGDADVLAMVFAPGAVLGYMAGQTAVNKTVGAAKFLSDAGWKIPLLSSLPSLDLDLKDAGSSDSSSGGSSNSAPEKEERSLLAKLGGLFYIESSWLKGDILLEAEEQKATPSFDVDLENWLNATGVSGEFQKSAEDFHDAYKSYIGSIRDEAMIKITALDRMLKSASLEDLMQSASQAKDADIDAIIDSEELSKKIDAAAESLVSSEEFDADAAAPEGKSANDKAVAKKTAFIQFKKDFDKKVIERISFLKNQASELIKESQPPEGSMEFIKKTPSGIKFLKIFSDSLSDIENSSKLAQ